MLPIILFSPIYSSSLLYLFANQVSFFKFFFHLFMIDIERERERQREIEIERVRGAETQAEG